MTRPINATLFIPSFDATGTPGEYTFTNGEYLNQADTAGNGAYDVSIGSLLYVPANDLATGFPITGVVHRYKLTAVTVVDTQFVSGTVIWDEPGEEQDAPQSGVFCAYSEATANRKLGLPPSDLIYPNLPPGTTNAAHLLNLKHVIDFFGNGGIGGGDFLVVANVSARDEIAAPKPGSVVYTLEEDISWQYTGSAWKEYKPRPTRTFEQTTDSATWVFGHNMGTKNFTWSVFDEDDSSVFPNRVKALDDNTIEITFSMSIKGRACFTFDLL